MGKAKHKIRNWQQYNQALVNRGSLTVRMDDDSIRQWYCQSHHGRRGCSFQFSDNAIAIALMLKNALEGFIDSIGLNVFGEGEWKTRKHGKEKRRIWHKVHVAIDATNHVVIAAEVSLIQVKNTTFIPE